MLPTHTADGFLPAGIHQATWDEFVATFGTNDRREALLDGLLDALTHLHEAGCTRVVIGGSFITTKAQPKDIDGLWDVTDVDPTLLHPVFLGPDGLTAMKAYFGCELFPMPILIEHVSGLPFLEFFQRSRGGEAVGVVEIALSTLP